MQWKLVPLYQFYTSKNTGYQFWYRTRKSQRLTSNMCKLFILCGYIFPIKVKNSKQLLSDFGCVYCMPSFQSKYGSCESPEDRHHLRACHQLSATPLLVAGQLNVYCLTHPEWGTATLFLNNSNVTFFIFNCLLGPNFYVFLVFTES